MHTYIPHMHKVESGLYWMIAYFHTTPRVCKVSVCLKLTWQGVVVHAYDASSLETYDRKITSLRLSWTT